MRLFLAVGLALIVGLVAGFRPGHNMPGREVGVAESSRVIGGGSDAACNSVSCGTNPCPSGLGWSSGCGTTCSTSDTTCQVNSKCQCGG
jgi:hypothetical protein